ncbi:MAG TPA: cobalt chelatase, partial [Armatimonadetes bacterium]|nr:cobalt chelatase [Armatimonadota bacterium]
MKLFSIMWSSYTPLLKAGVDKVGHLELSVYSTKQISQKPELLEKVKQDLKKADLILLYKTNDPFWETIEEEIKHLRGRLPVIVVGSDPSYWSLSTVSPEVVATVYQYILYNGQENFCEMLKYLLATLFGHEIAYRPPKATPWEGIFHPEIGSFDSVEDFLKSYPYRNRPLVGLLYSRSNWITGNMEVERALIVALEGRGLGVIPVFFYSLKDKALGNLSGEEVVRKFLVKGKRPLVEVLVKLTSFFLGSKRGETGESQAEAGAGLLLELGIPLISPLISYYKDKEEWLDDPQGLGGQVAWSVAMPEFEGAIE